MYLLNDLKFDINTSRTVGDTQYPRGWFLDPGNRAAAGVTEVPDPVWPDPELFAASENPDGTLTVTPLAAEAITERDVFRDSKRIATLWQAAHDYEFAQINGSAIGLLTLGVLQAKPKCLAVQAWLKGIWTEYYARKASGSTDYDFTVAGECPHTIPDLMAELGV